MNKYFNKIYLILFSSLFFVLACSKESSFETGNGLATVAQGTLKDSVGNCQGIGISGTYAVDTVFTDSNYVTVTATITTPGIYKIYTDTVNGFWFSDSAYIFTFGTQTFKLKGYGKPILPIASNFTVFFNTSYCLFSITPSGVGGTGATPASGQYFPISTNSNWTYNFNTGVADTVRYTCTNLVATFNSNTYRLFVSTHSDSLLYRKDSLLGNYYKYMSFTADPGSNVAFEYKFLDDKQPVNSFWESPEFTFTSGGVSYTQKIRLTIDAKNTSYTFNGNSFANVIKVRQETWQKDATGTFVIVTGSTSYHYYAKNIGTIWSDYPNGSVPYYEKLQRWQIF